MYYRNYFGRNKTEFSIPLRSRPKKIPMLLSRKKVSALLRSPVNLKHQALLTTIYALGLRVSEAVMLRPEHIESSRMILRVEQRKGVAVNRGRHFLLCPYCKQRVMGYLCDIPPMNSC